MPLSLALTLASETRGETKMRLMGLPNTNRYPEATVRRGEGNVEIHFSGAGEEQTMNVPLRYVGGDEEEAELLLLAQLREIGYRVRRC